MPNKDMIIAIDGFSSCGKSTFAKSIAQYMGYAYIDTGAMYRAVTLYFLHKGILHNTTIEKRIIEKELENINIQFVHNPKIDSTETHLNGQCVEKEIRDKPVAENVSKVAAMKEVRNKLVNLQRKAGANKRVVLDGRDIGTVVFPGAEIKIFMTAEVATRAERRYKELVAKGMEQPLAEIENNIQERDYLDQNREESPLQQAKDAIVLDNSHMTPEEQMAWFKELLSKKTKAV